MMLLFSNDGKLVIGLTKGNVERLLERKPGSIRGPYPMRVQEILIVYGEDKPDIVRQLEAAGVDLAQAIKDHAAEEPS